MPSSKWTSLIKKTILVNDIQKTKFITDSRPQLRFKFWVIEENEREENLITWVSSGRSDLSAEGEGKEAFDAIDFGETADENSNPNPQWGFGSGSNSYSGKPKSKNTHTHTHTHTHKAKK